MRQLVFITFVASYFMMLDATAKEVSPPLPIIQSQLPFFETVKQAQARSDDYDRAIDKADEAQDNCTSESECNKLSLLETDLEYAKSAHIDKNGLDMFDLLGGPAYSPEGGIMAAIGGLYSFKTDRDQTELQRSSVSLFGVGSKTDGGLGYGIRSKQNLFFDNNAIRYTGHFLLANQSENFWGVGQDAGERREPSDDTLLDKMSLTYNANLDFQNTYGFYIGPAIRIKYFDPDQSTLPPSAIEDENFQAFKDKPLSIGLGFSVNYDSRDVTVNAWQGQYLNFEYINYNPAFGSDNQYEKVLLDHRYYLSLEPGQVLAFYNAFQWSTGDVPYYDIPTLGGQSSLRGVYQGRYRDYSTIEHTLEYRHTFLRGNGDLSAHGMTLWAGVGSIAGTDTDLYQELLYSYGIGYRYELQPRMNVRLDLGLSEDGNGFYLTFTEAF